QVPIRRAATAAVSGSAADGAGDATGAAGVVSAGNASRPWSARPQAAKVSRAPARERILTSQVAAASGGPREVEGLRLRQPLEIRVCHAHQLSVRAPVQRE